MTNSAETLDLDIEQTVGAMLRSHDEARTEALLVRFAAMSDVELQSSFDSHHLERPATVLGEAALRLQDVSGGRTLPTKYADSFITRNKDCTAIDTWYDIYSRDAVAPALRIRSVLRGQMDTACIIDVRDDEVTVTERQWRRGAYRDIASQRADTIIPAITANMIWAVAQAKRRAEQGTQAQADFSAKGFLAQQIRQDRGIVAF